MPVLKANYVVPVKTAPIPNGAVAIVGDTIKAVGNAQTILRNFPGETVEDFGNAAITPGFVNCHTHLELTAFRGAVDHLDNDFVAWLIEITRLRKSHESGHSLYSSALMGAFEGAAAGVTTIGDIGRNGEAGMSALKKSGLRGIVFQETEFSPDDANADAAFGTLITNYEALAANETGLVKAGMSPHTPYTVSGKLFEKIARYSIENDIALTIHAAESEAETGLMLKGEGFFATVYQNAGVEWRAPGKRSIEYLYDLGVTAAKPLLVHCVQVNEDEIDLIGRTGSRIAHCPKSNAKFGHGFAPLSKFIQKGVTTGLGTDSMASNNSCDMFEEARFAGLVSRSHDKTGKFVDAEQIFALATLGGAEAMGLQEITGSLEAGKQADIAVISLDGIAQTPPNSVYSTLVFSTNAASVKKTIVAGETVYEDGKSVGVDIEALKAEVSELFRVGN